MTVSHNEKCGTGIAKDAFLKLNNISFSIFFTQSKAGMALAREKTG